MSTQKIHTYYGETHVPYFSRDVLLYQIASSKKPRWYVRIHLQKPEKGRGKGKTYLQQSLRTTDLNTAVERALLIWREVGTKEAKGLNVFQPTFSEVAERLLGDESFSLSQGRRKYIGGVVERYLNEYFSGVEVDQIDFRDVENYIQWRVLYWKRADNKDKKKAQNKVQPTRATVRQELGCIIQIMRYAVRLGYRTSAPDIASAKLTKNLPHTRTNARNMSPAYTRKLRGKLRELAKLPGKKPEETWARKQMYYFFLIVGRCCIRSGTESQNIQIKDLEKVQHPKYRAHYYKIRITKGKIGQRVAICPLEYVQHIDKLLELHKQAHKDDSNSTVKYADRHLFGNLDGSYKGSNFVCQRYRYWLKKWDLRIDPEFGRWTPYTLRSAQINNLLYNKKRAPAIVADIAGTSLDMIVRKYMSGDESDPSWAETASADVYDRLFPG